MAMAVNGLAKLCEECGELSQVVGKLLAYPDGVHPDGGSPLSERLEEEIADTIAACYFVSDTHNLSQSRIQDRITAKLKTYHAWHDDPSN